jgi:hypothetical protein
VWSQEVAATGGWREWDTGQAGPAKAERDGSQMGCMNKNQKNKKNAQQAGCQGCYGPKRFGLARGKEKLSFEFLSQPFEFKLKV